jgi:hypothetical protein
MSIYGRRKGLMDYEEFQRTPQARNADKPAHGGNPGANDDFDEKWREIRRARPADYLLPIGERWLRGLPPEVLPAALLTTFPRIANLIAMQWDDRHACAEYFEELLTDRRGGRRGFPPNVERDLSHLRNYWYSRATPTSDRTG